CAPGAVPLAAGIGGAARIRRGIAAGHGGLQLARNTDRGRPLALRNGVRRSVGSRAQRRGREDVAARAAPVAPSSALRLRDAIPSSTMRPRRAPVRTVT